MNLGNAQKAWCLFTEGPFDNSHGTGALLGRFFSSGDWPPLVGFGQGRQKAPWLSDWNEVQPSVPRPILTRAWCRFLRSLPRYASWLGQWLPAPTSRTLCITTSMSPRWRPELLYATAHTAAGIEFLQKFRDSTGCSVPIVQHFYDLLIAPEEEPSVGARLADLARHGTTFWALTASIAETIERISGVRPEEVFTLTVDIAAPRSDDVPPPQVDRPMRLAMVGNIWDAPLIPAARRLLARAHRVGAIDLPVTWFSHPSATERLKSTGYECDPEIRNVGFAPNIHDSLRDFDMGLVVFNAFDEPENNYARHSMPSRIMDFAARGLPILFLGGRRTPGGRLISEHGLGLVSPLQDEAGTVRHLEFLKAHPSKRSEMGRAAREFALAHGNLSLVRQKLHARLRWVAHSRLGLCERDEARAVFPHSAL
jgi:hypothetical protein